MVIAKRIRDLRREQGLSLDDLAARAGLQAGVIAHLEDGKEIPNFDVLESLAQALAVPTFRLFYDDGQLPLTPHLTARATFRELAEER
jgi:transcriptional regulator with XRE-family HTH domain